MSGEAIFGVLDCDNTNESMYGRRMGVLRQAIFESATPSILILLQYFYF